MTYNVIENVKKENLNLFCFTDEQFKPLLSSPYLVSNRDRIWYNDRIYYNISLDDFFKYVLHKGEDLDD